MHSPNFRTLLLVICASFSVVLNRADEAPKPIEPEYIGVFFRLEDAKLMPLERAVGTVQTKMKKLGYAGADVFKEIPGEASTVRFKQDQKLEFVVKAASQDHDPNGLIEFHAVTPKKGGRRVPMTSAGPFGLGAHDASTEKMIPFNVAKYGQSSFKFSPAEKLTPGEYCLGTTEGTAYFCFGIDGDQPPQNGSKDSATSDRKKKK